MKKADYYLSSRPELMKYIPKTAVTFLDVGCGAGNFGKEIKKRDNAVVWGVEYDKKSSDKAKKVLNKVLNGDIAEVYSQLPDGYFDCVFFNDVIEHLTDPAFALRQAKKKLKKGGIVVCSVPNLRFFPVLSQILFEKDFIYAKFGVVDETHLRFFTKKSIIRLFEDLNFEVLKIEGINKTKKFIYQIINLLVLNIMEDSFYQQFVIIAR